MSWMQNVRDGTLHLKASGCLFRHQWHTHQHFFRADDNPRVDVVIAWKQCRRCGKSKLIHILK